MTKAEKKEGPIDSATLSAKELRERNLKLVWAVQDTLAMTFHGLYACVPVDTYVDEYGKEATDTHLCWTGSTLAVMHEDQKKNGMPLVFYSPRVQMLVLSQLPALEDKLVRIKPDYVAYRQQVHTLLTEWLARK